MGANSETPRSTLSTTGGGIPEARKKDVRLRERFQLPEFESCIGAVSESISALQCV